MFTKIIRKLVTFKIVLAGHCGGGDIHGHCY